MAIRAYLGSLPTAVVDPINPAQYLMSSNPDTLREGIAKRRQNPERVPYTLIVVFPSPSCILIGMRSTDTAPARAFVEWLQRHQTIRIRDQEFNDFTKEATDNLDFVFGPEESTR